MSWRNFTFTKVAYLHYSWKYNVRTNVNSDLSILTTRNFTDRKRDGIPMLLYFHALPKVVILDACFPCFLNCANGIKSRNASHKINCKW